MANLCFKFTQEISCLLREILDYVESNGINNFDDIPLDVTTDSVNALLCVSEYSLPFALDHVHCAGVGFARLAYNFAYSCLLSYDETQAYFAYVCHKLSWHLLALSGLDVESGVRVQLSLAYGLYREGFIESSDDAYMDYPV